MPTLTLKEFEEIKDRNDLCFEIAEGKLSDDFQDYLDERADLYKEDDIRGAIEEAKCIRIYWKERYRIPEGYVAEFISGYLEDNYGFDSYEMGYLEDIIGKEPFEQFEKLLNEKLHGYYTEYEFFADLDASKEVEEYLRSK